MVPKLNWALRPVGIYKNLRRLFSAEEHANQWVKRLNAAFDGRAALEVMIDDLGPVRGYLDAQQV